MVECCGLVVCPSGDDEPKPVSLIGVSVHASIVDLVAQVTIEQRYVNRENTSIEAVYKFPLDDGTNKIGESVQVLLFTYLVIFAGAAVCRFTAEVDGRFIEGVVKETKQAEQDYKEGIESGHTAFLVEEKLPDVFKVLLQHLPKIGNLFIYI